MKQQYTFCWNGLPFCVELFEFYSEAYDAFESWANKMRGYFPDDVYTFIEE